MDASTTESTLIQPTDAAAGGPAQRATDCPGHVGQAEPAHSRFGSTISDRRYNQPQTVNCHAFVCGPDGVRTTRTRGLT